MTNTIGEIEDTNCIMVIGSNTTGQHPMIASKIMTAREKGAKLIVIDPRRIPLSEYADLFLEIKPGTNVALLNGMINILIERKLINEAFIEERTEGFEELKSLVKQYPPEKVSEITGVNIDFLERAAVVYGQAEKAMILYAMGVTQHTTGTDNVKAVANLAMAAGQIGRPATGVNPLRGQNNVQGACDMGALPNVLSGYQVVSDPLVRKRFEDAWAMSVPEKPGLTVVEMTHAASQGTIKGMLIVGENPMLTDPDINHVRDGLEALQLLVVQDIFLTETAKLAHIVLPACSFAEKDGTFTNTDRRVQRVRKAIDPIGDSKPDWQIISELAQTMGKKNFGCDSPSGIMQEIRSLTPSYAGITYDRLDRGEVLHWPCPQETHPGTPVLHQERFVKGKGKFHAVDYTPPLELADDEYPYTLTTGRVPFHFHGGSMTRRIPRLDEEVPAGYALIHPRDGKKLGVEEGEAVLITSRRGHLDITAKLSSEVQPGMVFIPMHFVECAANILTDTKLDAISKIPELKVCAVRVEKKKKE